MNQLPKWITYTAQVLITVFWVWVLVTNWMVGIGASITMCVLVYHVACISEKSVRDQVRRRVKSARDYEEWGKSLHKEQA